MSISKDNLIYGVISRTLTLQNALCRCTFVLDYLRLFTPCVLTRKTFTCLVFKTLEETEKKLKNDVNNNRESR